MGIDLSTSRTPYWCPRCGVRQHHRLRDPYGGMWRHLRCRECGCAFDVRTMTEEDRRRRRAEYDAERRRRKREERRHE